MLAKLTRLKLHLQKDVILNTSRVILTDFASVVCIYNAGGMKAAVCCFAIFGFFELSTNLTARKLSNKSEEKVENELRKIEADI